MNRLTMALLGSTVLMGAVRAPEGDGGGPAPKPDASAPKPRFEASFGDDRATVGSFGEGGENKARSESHADRSNLMEFGRDGKPVAKEKPDAAEADSEDDLPDPDKTGEDAPDADANDAGDTEGGEDDRAEKGDDKPLPAEVDPGEWDASKPEVVEAFDKKYWNEDGSQLNLTAFNATLEANIALNGKADIAPGERAYLKDRLGLSDEAITQHIAGVVAVRAENDKAFYSLPFVGSKEAHEARIEWASKGYTPAQKAAFNAAMAKGGDDAKEALELLDMRASKGGLKLPGKAPAQRTAAEKIDPQRKGPPGRRDASPKRDATAGAGTSAGKPGVEPFKSADEHRKAQAKAMKSGDKAELATVRDRLKASPALWK